MPDRALSLNAATGRAQFQGVTAKLSRMEATLLAFLIEHRPRAYSSSKLLERVWGYPPYIGSKVSVRMCVYAIRKKLGADSILNKSRHGYYVL